MRKTYFEKTCVLQSKDHIIYEDHPQEILIKNRIHDINIKRGAGEATQLNGDLRITISSEE